MTQEDIRQARWEYVSQRLANPDYPTYNDEHELEAAFDAGIELAQRMMIDRAVSLYQADLKMAVNLLNRVKAGAGDIIDVEKSVYKFKQDMSKI